MKIIGDRPPGNPLPCEGQAAAVVSWVAVATVVVLVPPKNSSTGGYLDRVFVFSVAAFTTRILVQATQSRWQLVAIWSVGLAGEMVGSYRHGSNGLRYAGGADAAGALIGLVIGRAVAYRRKRLDHRRLDHRRRKRLQR